MKEFIRSCMFLTSVGFFDKFLGDFIIVFTLKDENFKKCWKKKEIYAITKFLVTAHAYKPRKNIQIVLKKVFVSFTETQKYTHIPPKLKFLSWKICI